MVYKHIVLPCLSFLPCNAINCLVRQTEKRDAFEDDELKTAKSCHVPDQSKAAAAAAEHRDMINDQQNVAMQQDNKILKVTEKIEATKAKQEILETTTSASTESCRGGPPPITPPAAIKTVQRKWPCAICQVTTTSETTLNSHFKGKLHKTACEKLRRTTRASKDKVVRSSASKEKPKPNVVNSLNNQSLVEGQKWRCAICNVNCSGEYDLYCHLIGRKHISMSQA